MMRRQIVFCVLIVLMLVCGLSFADEEWLDRGDVALKQALVDLTNDQTIMCIAAHPDDEDGATLTYYRKKHGVRTSILLATRGEGGQNEIGPELYEELGVIRAYETQAAARIYGVEVYNLNKRDFGYSKSAEETFRIWGHEDSLRRLVEIIRKVMPDVIITNHDTEHGHGHHQAVGILVLEAFEAAAVASAFPEQIKGGLNTWQVKRLFLRCSREDADVTVNVGEYDQARGYSYAQIANEGLKMHKSQGMGGNVRRGPAYRYYKLIRASEPVPDKLDSLMGGMTGSIETPGFIKDALESVSFPHQQVAKNLVSYIRELRDLKMEDRLSEPKDLEVAAARSLDLYLNTEVDDGTVVPGQSVTVRVSLTNCGHQDIEDIKFSLHVPRLGEVIEGESLSFEKLGYNETATGSFVVRVSEDAALTLPRADHLYDDAFMKPLVCGIAEYSVYDTRLSITSEAAADVTDDMEIHILPQNAIIPISSRSQIYQYVVDVINRMPGNIGGQVELLAPVGWDVSGIEREFALIEDQHDFIAFNVTFPPDISTGDFPIEARSSYKKADGGTGFAITKGLAKVVDVKTADDLNVGYVKSYDNTLEWALKQLRVKSRSLDFNDLRFGDLSVYDTIILDIRAYLVRGDLIDCNQRLLDYVHNGGNLIVMYHKIYEWDEGYAPYKLILSSNRVTVEESPITILAPDHPLLIFPNRITEQDWDGWVQERGLYFPSEWAPQYTELLSCSDPGESPLKGGYLVARYGKGTYIYTSFVWYRQLQNLNPGAFRNFANMISLPKFPSD